MTDPNADLVDIVRQRYETGAYGNTHIRMHGTDRAWMERQQRLVEER